MAKRLSILSILARIGILLLVLGAAAATAIVLFIRSPFPKTRGSYELEGIQTKAEILRDEDGVPHIYADSMADLMFAQGFVHAQDRFWQMEYWRRIGSGRLSELFGEGLVETDRFLRTMGFLEIAREEVRLMGAAERSYLESYAKGVTAYIRSRPAARLGLEFAILGLTGVDIEIEDWKPEHSLTWAKMMAYDLSGNMTDERRILKLLADGGRSLLELYEAPYRQDMPFIVSNDELARFREHWNILGDLSGDTDQRRITLPRNGKEGIGSNNWVIGPQLTDNGHPLVANDMHLSVQMPSIWYENGLHLQRTETSEVEGSYDVRGYSFPGIPGIVTGQNADVAWGVTNVGGDVQDYYLETINPRNPDQYLYDGEWRTMETRVETIRVHDKDEPVRHRVRRTVHGPVLSDLASQSELATYGISPGQPFPDRVELGAVSLSWTALEPSRMVEAMFGYNRARSLAEFREALRLWDVPGQNFVMADASGNIAYQTTGSYPVRDGHSGLTPADGSGAEDWTDRVPFDQLPGLYNPQVGYIVTANNPIAPPEYPHLIGLSFANGYRARQIVERIESYGGNISREDLQAIHADVSTLHGRELVAQLSELEAEAALESFESYREELGVQEEEDLDADEARELVAAGLAVLTDWDYSMAADSAGAAAYAYLWNELIDLTLRDEVRYWEGIPGGVASLESVFYELFADPNNLAWDNRLTPTQETMQDMLAIAMVRGFLAAAVEMGSDPEKWEWGEVHGIEFRNATLGQSGIGIVEGIFNRGPYPIGGSSSTVNVTHWRLSEPFDTSSHSSQRSIVDPVDPDRSLFVHPTGQSGHPFHRFYDNFIDPWREVQYHPGRWSREAVEQSAGNHRLLLRSPNWPE